MILNRAEADSSRTGVKEIEKKTKMLMVSTALVLAVLSGIAIMAYANGAANDTNTNSNAAPTSDQSFRGMGPIFGGRGFGGGRGGGCGGGTITVSQEFRDNVINIAENDSDVQTLITDGYNVTNVRPIITTTVAADGTVTMKATSAIVMLEQGTTGRAAVWVDVEQAKVTRIEIVSMTVIDKT
jgi:hypothetical protein